eukprot:CAMPEP_0184479654 /NCGR_PEP_ID=MMETSP0113_2-20130426/1296_1 /TAXON_ID=91329 /ORGANISM="Norrisiella sphaerica, Strain BC52" /LENGTH=98 /DNA_ID=CAMNT_0026857779 /DNA_START=66 /DNA_END=362 /DNA_ORIENTATION=+
MNNMQGVHMSKKEQKEFELMMQDMMFREMQEMYIGLVDRCFSKCVNAFRTRKLQSSENTCISNCVAKSLAHNQRVQLRFQEQNQMMGAQAAMQQQNKK